METKIHNVEIEYQGEEIRAQVEVDFDRASRNIIRTEVTSVQVNGDPTPVGDISLEVEDLLISEIW